MKTYYLVALLFLTACSSTPKLVLRPQQPTTTSADGIRYPEILRAYHIGRYADPNDDSLMYEQHAVYRVEDTTRWNFHPGPAAVNLAAPSSRDAAFAPAPVNDAILAEVNSQKAATTEIMMQARTLSAALAQFQTALQQTKTNLQETVILRESVNAMRQRLDALESTQRQQPPFSSSTNTSEPADPLSP